MPENEMVIIWLGSSIMLFVAWILIPEHAKKEGDKAAQIPNPVFRQGAIFTVYLVHWLAGSAFVVLVFVIMLWILARVG